MRPRIDGKVARTFMVLRDGGESYSGTIERLLNDPPTVEDLLTTIVENDFQEIRDVTEQKDTIRRRIRGEAEEVLKQRTSGGTSASDAMADVIEPEGWDGLDVAGYAAEHSDSYVRTINSFADWYESVERVGPPTAVDVQDWLDHLDATTDWSESTMRLHYHGMKSYALYEGAEEPDEDDDGPPKEIQLDQLRSLADDLGRTPTAREVHESDYDALAIHHLQDMFGTFNQALEEAGLEPNEEKTGPLSKEELIDAIIELRDELGRWPKAEDMTNHGPHSTSTYHNRFGTYTNAVDKAKERETQVA